MSPDKWLHLLSETLSKEGTGMMSCYEEFSLEERIELKLKSD